MKKLIFLALSISTLFACSDGKREQADRLIESAEKSLAQGNYRVAMDSISKLRAEYPEEIEARRAAMPLWNEAQMQLAQHEIARADSMMMAIDSQLADSTHLTLFKKNKLKFQRDSLKARYDVNCTIVRKIKANE